jgi:hypothetical protein
MNVDRHELELYLFADDADVRRFLGKTASGLNYSVLANQAKANECGWWV